LRYGFKAQAERISAAARQALNVSAIGPLDAKRYAEHVGVQILTIEELDLSDDARRQLLEVDPTSWSGMAIRESGLIGVLLNPTHSPERQDSTMMHELSHIVLKHAPIRVDVSSAGILLVSEYSADDEDEANWLSGALLLPRDALRRYREKGWPAAKIIAHFGVSQDMYNWRIRMTGVDVQMRRSRASV
jgi:Zn-dependent peptidase ImmA (M78 family)